MNFKKKQQNLTSKAFFIYCFHLLGTSFTAFSKVTTSQFFIYFIFTFESSLDVNKKYVLLYSLRSKLQTTRDSLQFTEDNFLFYFFQKHFKVVVRQ